MNLSSVNVNNVCALALGIEQVCFKGINPHAILEDATNARTTWGHGGARESVVPLASFAQTLFRTCCFFLLFKTVSSGLVGGTLFSSTTYPSGFAVLAFSAHPSQHDHSLTYVHAERRPSWSRISRSRVHSVSSNRNFPWRVPVAVPRSGLALMEKWNHNARRHTFGYTSKAATSLFCAGQDENYTKLCLIPSCCFTRGGSWQSYSNALQSKAKQSKALRRTAMQSNEL